MTLKDTSNKLLEISNGELVTEEQKTELYKACLLFSKYFFTWKNCCNDREIYNQVVVIAAEQLYILIMSGKRYNNWFSYMCVGYGEYFDIWRSLYAYRGQKASEDDGVYMPVLKPGYTPSDVSYVIEKIDTSRTLWSLYKELNSYLRICNRFSSKVSVLNARVSIQLSIKYNRFVNFRLSGTDLQMCRFLYNKFKREFRKLMKLSNSILSDSHITQLIASDIFVMNDDVERGVEAWISPF